MGWCLAERSEKKKHYKQRSQRSAVCVLFWTPKSWSKAEKMHGTWTPHLVMDGLEWFATTRYLTSFGDWSLNWYDKCVYIDIWADCKILHDVAYSTFVWQKSNRIQSNCQPQPTHACLRLRNPSKEDTQCSNIWRLNDMKLVVTSMYFVLICSKQMWLVCCGHDTWLVPNRLLAWLLFTRPVMRCQLGPRRCGRPANDVGREKTTELVQTGWFFGVK